MAVSFNTIPANVRVPLFYAEVDNSMANTATTSYKSLLIGQKLSTGTAAADVPVFVSSVAKAKTLFGRGSELALAVEAYKAVDASGELWVIPASVTGANASCSVTVAGLALASGAVSLYIGGKRVQVSVAQGATASTVATDLAAAINADSDLPVSAEVVAPEDEEESTSTSVDVTVTAKDAGVYGNDILLQSNYLGTLNGEENVSGLTVTPGIMTGGTGSIDYTAALATVSAEAYQFIGIADADTTALDAVKVDMNDTSGRWSYARMQFGHVFTAKRGEAETLMTFGNSRNDQHASVFGVEPNNPNPVWVIGASALARASVFYRNDPARPLQTGVLVGLTVPNVADRFNFNDRQALLSNGIATLTVGGSNVMIERAITTYQRNSFGDADNSYLDSATLYTIAYIIGALKTAITSKYARHKLANDGTRYGPGQAIVTPKVIKSELIAQYGKLEALGLVENAELFAKYLIVERNANDVNRIDVLLPPDIVNQLRIFAMQVQFRLQFDEE
jgi:phage tail sheath gpL-like